MDLPLCKICGERHRLGFCPKYQDPATSERRRWLAAMSGSPVAMPTGPARTEPVATVTPKPFVKPPVTPVKEKPDAPETAGPPQVEQHHQAPAAPETPQEAPPEIDTLYRARACDTRSVEIYRTVEFPLSPAKPKFDKKAYQRELMRKRRAAAKMQPALPLSG